MRGRSTRFARAPRAYLFRKLGHVPLRVRLALPDVVLEVELGCAGELEFGLEFPVCQLDDLDARSAESEESGS